MRHPFTWICVLLLVAGSGYAQSAQSKSEPDKTTTDDKTKTDDKTTDRAQLVTSVEILKIDAKKKTLQVRQIVEPNTSQSGQDTPRRRNGGTGTGGGNGGGGYPGGGYPGGGYPGGGRRRGGGGYPGGGYPGGGGGGGRYPGGGGGTQTTQAKEYKVFVSKDTSYKFAGANIDFEDLHLNDRITVSGFPKGTKGDMDAMTITRQ